MDRQAILDAINGGDRRSIGRAHQVVASVRREPSLFPALMNGLRHADELVRMRAADAAEKLTATNPHWLQPFKRRFMSLAARVELQELRWHLAQDASTIGVVAERPHDGSGDSSALSGGLEPDRQDLRDAGIVQFGHSGRETSGTCSTNDLFSHQNWQSGDEK